MWVPVFCLLTCRAVTPLAQGLSVPPLRNRFGLSELICIWGFWDHYPAALCWARLWEQRNETVLESGISPKTDFKIVQMLEKCHTHFLITVISQWKIKSWMFLCGIQLHGVVAILGHFHLSTSSSCSDFLCFQESLSKVQGHRWKLVTFRKYNSGGDSHMTDSASWFQMFCGCIAFWSAEATLY